jgi:DNA-binding NarL/FixJ family response regulator
MSGGNGLTGMAERVALRGGQPEAGPFGGRLYRRSESPARPRFPDGAGVIPAAPPIRVLVADSQRLIREGLSALLGTLPEIEVVGTAIDGDDAVQQALALAPDVVLMDLYMPNCGGVEATRRLTGGQPCTCVVVLTSSCDEATVMAALRAGARGYLTKDAGAAEILQAVSAVCGGGAHLDPSIQRSLVEAIARGDPFGLAENSDDQPQQAPQGLTPREVEVLTEVASGLSNAQIAERLCVSTTTIKAHVKHLLAKTGMHDRAQLVAYAFRLGLVR